MWQEILKSFWFLDELDKALNAFFARWICQPRFFYWASPKDSQKKSEQPYSKRLDKIIF